VLGSTIRLPERRVLAAFSTKNRLRGTEPPEPFPQAPEVPIPNIGECRGRQSEGRRRLKGSG
jgi:hypothetical protein